VQTELDENVAVARSAQEQYAEAIEKLFAARFDGGLCVRGKPTGAQQNQSRQNFERQAAPGANLTSESVHRDFANFENERRMAGLDSE
jgi:hypothetical protein